MPSNLHLLLNSHHLIPHWRVDALTFRSFSFRPQPFQLFFINFVINIFVAVDDGHVFHIQSHLRSVQYRNTMTLVMVVGGDWFVYKADFQPNSLFFASSLFSVPYRHTHSASASSPIYFQLTGGGKWVFEYIKWEKWWKIDFSVAKDEDEELS